MMFNKRIMIAALWSNNKQNCGLSEYNTYA